MKTTAEIVGKEVGEEVVRRYYPDLAPLPLRQSKINPQKNQPPRKPIHPLLLILIRKCISPGLTLMNSYPKENKRSRRYMEKRRQYMWITATRSDD